MASGETSERVNTVLTGAGCGAVIAAGFSVHRCRGSQPPSGGEPATGSFDYGAALGCVKA